MPDMPDMQLNKIIKLFAIRFLPAAAPEQLLTLHLRALGPAQSSRDEGVTNKIGVADA